LENCHRIIAERGESLECFALTQQTEIQM